MWCAFLVVWHQNYAEVKLEWSVASQFLSISALITWGWSLFLGIRAIETGVYTRMAYVVSGLVFLELIIILLVVPFFLP